jgi:hypothetical protein
MDSSTDIDEIRAKIIKKTTEVSSIKIMPVKVFKTAFTFYAIGTIDSINFTFQLSELGPHEVFTNKAIANHLDYKKKRLIYVWLANLIFECLVHFGLWLNSDYRWAAFYVTLNITREIILNVFLVKHLNSVAPEATPVRIL